MNRCYLDTAAQKADEDSNSRVDPPCYSTTYICKYARAVVLRRVIQRVRFVSFLFFSFFPTRKFRVLLQVKLAYVGREEIGKKKSTPCIYEFRRNCSFLGCLAGYEKTPGRLRYSGLGHSPLLYTLYLRGDPLSELLTHLLLSYIPTYFLRLRN